VYLIKVTPKPNQNLLVFVDEMGHSPV